jgi:hypothetical protein
MMSQFGWASVRMVISIAPWGSAAFGASQKLTVEIDCFRFAPGADVRSLQWVLAGRLRFISTTSLALQSGQPFLGVDALARIRLLISDISRN